MTKAEYMQKLQEKLEAFSRELQEDIMEDYRQHFAEGELQGKTDEEIINELGNIEDMIRDLPEADLKENILGQLPDVTCVSHQASDLEDAAEHEEESAAENTSEAEMEQSFVYPGKYETVILNGEAANIFLEASEDDQIHVEYVNRSPKNWQQYEYYQYEEDGIFYAGVKHRKAPSENTGAGTAEEGSSNESTKRHLKIGNCDISIDNLKNSFSFGNTNGNLSVENKDKAWKISLFGNTIISYGNMNNLDKNMPFILSVKIPDKMVRKLHVKTSSGDMQLEGLTLNELALESASGDIKAVQITPDNMRIQTSSGDMELSDITCYRLNLNARSGDIKLKDLTSQQADIKASSGDISLENITCSNVVLAGTSSDIDACNITAEVLDIHTSSGDIALSSITSQTIYMKASSGDIGFSDTTAKTVTVSTSSGDLSLSGLRFENGNFTSSQGDISAINTEFDTCNYTTESGDISANGIKGAFVTYIAKRGDISLLEGYNNQCKKYKCVTESGDISIQSTAEIYELAARGGDISVIAAGEPKTLSLKSTNGDLSAIASGTPESIDMRSDNGDVSLMIKETQGMEVNVDASWGDSEIQWKGEKKRIKKGTLTFGNGASKVTVCSKRGDINVAGSPQ